MRLIIFTLISFACYGQNDSIPNLSDALASESEASLQFHIGSDEPFAMWILKQPIQNYQPLILQPEQVFNVYVGLKQGEAYKLKFHDCSQAVKQLDSLIREQNDEIKAYAINESKFYNDIIKLKDESSDQKVEIQKLKDKRLPWHKHPLTFLALGIAGGIYIAK